MDVEILLDQLFNPQTFAEDYCDWYPGDYDGYDNESAYDAIRDWCDTPDRLAILQEFIDN